MILRKEWKQESSSSGFKQQLLCPLHSLSICTCRLISEQFLWRASRFCAMKKINGSKINLWSYGEFIAFTSLISRSGAHEFSFSAHYLLLLSLASSNFRWLGHHIYTIAADCILLSSTLVSRSSLIYLSRTPLFLLLPPAIRMFYCYKANAVSRY